MTVCSQVSEMAANSRKFGKAVASIKHQRYERDENEYEDDGKGDEHDYDNDGEVVEHDSDDDEK